MNPRRCFVSALVCCWLASRTFAQAPTQQGTIKQQIEQILVNQAQAWNQGNIDGFMEGYAKIPTLRFASGGTITYGWQETLDRYKTHYPDRATMGVLAFSDLDTTILSPDAAVVFGHWQLKAEKGNPSGLFTLMLRKTEVGWRIVADHTSAAAPVN